MESGLEPSLDGIAHRARNDDPTWRCLRLQSRRHIDIVAIDVIALDDDIAEVKADPKYDGLFLGLVAICLDHRLLELYRRSQRVHGATELNEAPSPVSLITRPPQRRQPAQAVGSDVPEAAQRCRSHPGPSAETIQPRLQRGSPPVCAAHGPMVFPVPLWQNPRSTSAAGQGAEDVLTS